MSKRNVILLIIILVVIVAVAFGFFYFYRPAQNGATPQGTNFFANFLPFGKSKTVTPTDNGGIPADVSGYVPTEGDNIQNSKLKKVSSFPVAGFGVFMKERFKDIQTITQDIPLPNLPLTKGEEKGGGIKPVIPPSEFAPALRYVNRATGNIYQTFADKLNERKFSSNIIPRVYEAFFGNNGQSVIMRYLKDDNKTIETFVGALQKEYLGADSVGTSDVTGSFLPENISDVSVSSDSSKMFYLFDIGDSAAGITYGLQDNKKVQVLDSPFTEWLSLYPNSKMITVTTKPSYGVPGFMYAINPDKKDFNKILGGISGLTTLASPDGKLVLYSDNNLSLNVFNITTGNSTLLGVKTLAEKCVWTPTSDALYCAVPKYIDNGGYPDSWYQGEVSFSDQIWKIDIASGSTTLLGDPATMVGEEVDGTKLALDEGQNFLFFVNKKDSYLWELNLK